MMDEKYMNPMDSAEIPSQPQGRCVICEDHLGVGNGYYRHVYAGANPDGSGRMAHKVCWQNMRDQLWLSFGISLDELSEKELKTRQLAKPVLGKPPMGLVAELRSVERLYYTLNTLMSEVEPETPEEIDAVIRAAGYDPDEVAERMQSLAARLIAEHERDLALTKVKAQEERIEAIDNAVAIQCSDGNWNYNDYMRGYANGLLFAQAVMHDRDYEPLEAIDSQAPRPNVRGPFIRRK